jgi:hypothetical protein
VIFVAVDIAGVLERVDETLIRGVEGGMLNHWTTPILILPVSPLQPASVARPTEMINNKEKEIFKNLFIDNSPVLPYDLWFIPSAARLRARCYREQVYHRGGRIVKPNPDQRAVCQRGRHFGKMKVQKDN